MPPDVVALFGPTATGKTAVATALGETLRARGEDPLAISCDAIQIYRGLEILSGAPSAGERARLEHRLVGVADPREEFSAGRFATLAREEIDSALESGRRPIVVGGTGLWMRAALAELDLAPPVPSDVRISVEAEIEKRGSQALHGELEQDVADKIHPNDRKRVARALELQRTGADPPERGGELWTAKLRHPTRLFGLVCDRIELDERISTRVDAMVAAGAVEEVERGVREGWSRTATAALGFEELRQADIDAMKASHRRYAKRQLTWLRKMPGIEIVDVSGRDPEVIGEDLATALVS